MNGSGQEKRGHHRAVVGPVFAHPGRMIRTHPVATRWVLAGPVVLAVSLLFTMSLAVVLPAGPAGVDNIVWPLVLAPVLWAMLFIYVCLEESLQRAAAILGVAGVLSAVSVTLALA